MSDTLTRFRQQAERLVAPERSKRRAELLERMRRDALAVIGLSSEITTRSEPEQSLGQLLEKLGAEAEEYRHVSEEQIDLALALAENATELWEKRWEEALRNPGADRGEITKQLRGVLTDAEQELTKELGNLQEDARRLGQPLARLDELQDRVAEFPLWVRECLARWEMLDEPAPPLDRERVARAQAAYARGEHEALGDVLSRVQGGGPWVKE
jgi:hypothetical protein